MGPGLAQNQQGDYYNITQRITLDVARRELLFLREEVKAWVQGFPMVEELRLIDDFLRLCQQHENKGDIYRYDGPWGVLCGSAGYCIVHGSTVTAAFATKNA